MLVALLLLGLLTPTATASQLSIREVAAGGNHTVAIAADGSLWAWGENSFGQLGTGVGELGNRTTPVRIGTDTNWRSVSAGSIHTVAIRTDGSLWEWGHPWGFRFGEITEEAAVARAVPRRIGTDTNWASVSAGVSHTVAIRTDGTLWAWGDNYRGQLGDGTTSSESGEGHITPRQIGTDSDWADVSAGGYHTVAIKTDGSLWAWGCNRHCQLGVEPWGWGYNRTVPVRVGTDANWTGISAGGLHTMAIRADGSLWAWGWNEFRQLGASTAIGWGAMPVRVGGDSDWASVSAGFYHTVATKADGSLWAWGDNRQGQLGDGGRYMRDTPGRIGSDRNWTSVAAGIEYTVGIRSDGSLWTWGRNLRGQLGDGTMLPSNVPLLIIPMNTARFTDVPANHWAREAILLMLEEQIMVGTSATTFSPDAHLSRAMAATMLWRMADWPFWPQGHNFHDVQLGLWYSDAVMWAAYAGIVQGTGPHTFSPHANITREQMATMLFRFARYFELDLTVTGDPLHAFIDRGAVSPWAQEGMRWAAYNGLITGASSTRLAPGEPATRAQAAVMLMRFLEAM